MSNINNFREEFSLITFFKLIKYKIKFLISFTLIFVIIVIIYSYIMPNTFLSTASILPPTKESGGTGLSSFIQSMTGGLDIGKISTNEQSKLFSKIINSRTVSDFIIENLNLNKHPYFKEFTNEKFFKFFNESINTEVDKSGIVYISTKISTNFFPGTESVNYAKKLSADITNTAIKGLDKVIRERTVSSAKISREYIENQLKSYKTKLDSISNEMEMFQKKNKVFSIDEQAQALVSQAIELGSQLAKAELEYNLAKLEFNNSPQVKFYKEQLDLLQQQYKKVQTGGLTNQDAFAIPLENIPTLMKEYADLFRQRKIYEQVIMYLETQHHQEAIQEKKDIPVVEVLDYARIPEEKYSPNRTAMAIFSLFFGSLIAVIIIIINAFRQGLVYVLDDKKNEV